MTDDGASWTPIGHNDAITWPDLAPLFRRRDLAAVERHLLELRAHGVTGMIELAPAGTLTGLAKRELKGIDLVNLNTPDDLEAARALAAAAPGKES